MVVFLIKYYGIGVNILSFNDFVDIVIIRDWLVLVMVVIKGIFYVIVDIGLCMFKLYELYWV